MITLAEAEAGVAAEAVLRRLREQARMGGGWRSCGELASEMRLPRHEVQRALAELGRRHLIERDVVETERRYVEVWRVAPSSPSRMDP